MTRKSNNVNESQIFSYQEACYWIERIEKELNEDFKSYFEIHKIRYMNTFEFHRFLPNKTFENILDLGGSGIFTSLAFEKFQSKNLFLTGFNEYDRKEEEKELVPSLDINKRIHKAINFDFDNPPSDATSNSFDLIYCLEVIEHISVDPAAFLRELRRILKSDGILMLSTPNITCLNSIEKILKGESPISYPYYRTFRTSDRHNIEYAPGQLKLLIEQSGFEILEMKTLNSWTWPSMYIENFCMINDINLEERGDDIFILAKFSPKEPIEFPSHIYD